MLDVAAVAAPRALERAYEQGWILGRLDAGSLHDVLDRAGRHKGATPLRLLLQRQHPGQTVTQSGLEELFLALIDDAGLQRPELNVHVPIPGEQMKVDCLWRKRRLVVELDSRRYHHLNPRAFTEDRRRDRVLRLSGYGAVRFTDEELTHRPDDVVRTIIELLKVPDA